MSSLLEGKVALVTGAGHGIGRAHALELASHGATVVVNDLGSSVNGEGSGRDADVVVGIIEGRGGKAIADYGDVGDEAQVEAMVAKAFDEFGHLDIVVNNAGIVRDRAIWNMTAADFDLVMRVHVRGSWLVSRAVAKRWRAIAKSDGGSVYGRDHQHHLRAPGCSATSGRPTTARPRRRSSALPRPSAWSSGPSG